jgi:dihydrofolate reductase
MDGKARRQLLQRLSRRLRGGQKVHSTGGGTTGIDDDFAQRGFAGIGASILERNMFGPVRGPWPDEAWKGWWGENPPYHTPVFVLTHHERPAITMDGGTTFHFVTGGAHQGRNEKAVTVTTVTAIMAGGSVPVLVAT